MAVIIITPTIPDSMLFIAYSLIYGYWDFFNLA
jgi:hypothetical protein